MSVIANIRERAACVERRQPLKLELHHFVWIFVICSLFGLVGETLVSYALDGRWESRAGFVVGPLSPIYGCGAVLITFFANPIRERGHAAVFVVSAFAGGVFEYFAGWFLEMRYGIVAWSYIDQPLNFQGHTSVFMMVVWGVIGLVWTMGVLDPIVRLIERIPENISRPLSSIVLILIFVDSALTLTALDCWFLRTSGVSVSGPVQEFFNAFFGDGYMTERFETMSMWPVLANR